MRNKKLLRSQRHLSQPITSDNRGSQAPNTGENIEVGSKGLIKTIKYNGKKYSVNLTKE